MAAATLGILREPAKLDRQSRVLLWLMVMASLYLAARAAWPGVVPVVFDCPFHAYLGLNCLGCGITRSCVLVMSGRFVEAMRYNPLAVLVLPFVAYWFTSLLSTAVLRRKLVSGWPRALTSGYQWAFIALASVVGIGRLVYWLYPASGDVLAQLLLIPPGH